MNYKLLFPTYRNRYLFIKNNLKAYGENKKFGKALNLGTGEGDYDPMIAEYCDQLVSCDINENDINFAKQLNGHLDIDYRIEDALNLSFPDNTFDLIVSVDVMEHVGKPERMTDEIARVLKPGGVAFITFPQLYFPWTYDPINRLLSFFTKKKISQGAYAFGHWYLIDGGEFKKWSSKNKVSVIGERNLSGHIVGLLEMYWTGLIQKLFKDNSGNVSGKAEKKVKLRPSTKEPALAAITDGILKLDYALFKNLKHSVGKGFIIKK